jgi:hypothetical protein
MKKTQWRMNSKDPLLINRRISELPQFGQLEDRERENMANVSKHGEE